MPQSQRSRLSYLGYILLTALVYFVSGKLGLKSAIPPGYATAVFPPAGIALVAVLLFGRRMAWGVWLGSAAMNIVITLESGMRFPHAAVLGVSIGLGAALQTLLSAALIRRFVMEAASPKTPSEIFKFLILGSTVGCLFSSLWGVGSLTLNGVVLPDNFFFSWFTWYVGDAIGVLIFAPLGLILLSPSYSRTWRKRTAYASILLVSYLFSMALYFYVNESAQNRIVADFHKRTDLATAQVARAIAERVLIKTREEKTAPTEILSTIEIGELDGNTLRELDLEGIRFGLTADGENSGPEILIQQKTTIRILNREWPVQFGLVRPYFFAQKFWETWRILAFGMLFTGILSGFTLTVLGRNSSLQKEVEAAAHQIRSQRQKIENDARLSSLGLMAGGIAHEINNPLTIVLGQSINLKEMAEQSELDRETIVKIADSINNSVLRISRIVKGLKNVSRDGSQDRREKTKLADILEDALSVCREKFKRHSVDLQIASTIGDTEIYCRRVEITQIIVNLLSNAFDAAKETKNGWVRVETSVHENRVILIVTDSGKGIPDEHIDKIMEPFFTTKKVGEGTGLGLSISLGIAKNHGGDLYLQKDSENTCFVLTLPLGRLS